LSRAGEDERTAGETCPLLLAIVSGEPSDETAVWRDARADRRAVASGGIAEAVGAGKSIQSQKGREGCLPKPDGKAVVSSCGTWIGAHGDPVPSPGPRQRKNNALDFLAGYIVWGCWELKRKFRLEASG